VNVKYGTLELQGKTTDKKKDFQRVDVFIFIRALDRLYKNSFNHNMILVPKWFI